MVAVFLNRNFIFIFLVIYFCYSNAQILEKDSECAKSKLDRVSYIPQTDAKLIVLHGKSKVSCIYQCERLELPSSYFIENNSTCYCSSDDSNNMDKHDDADTTIIRGIRKEKVSIKYIQEGSQKVKRVHKQPEPVDCLAFYQQGYTEDGVYVIKPTGSTATDVWCDMTNGGWTVIQRRQDGSDDFYRNWEDYKNGFGNRSSEYWLGLEQIYYLTIADSSLYVCLETFEIDNRNPVSAYAEYSTFSIKDESDKYRLLVGGYSGSCGNSLLYHNNNQFTTKDSDNDQYSGNCAVLFSGAWWYNNCDHSNLNGLYPHTN
ncbi:angiopoietin-related protein 1-like, partial [Ruditapes philippinarum]|uniref:angiopoietin-related protein 1-like n=1 Tax=Ruditapes philippinarum TaxID=129788 RepID=UPI00295B3465